RRATRLLEVISPRGPTLLPVNSWTVVASAVGVLFVPRTRSVCVGAVQARSMCGHDMSVARGMLSQRMYGTPEKRYPSKHLRRSSSLGDHAAAAGAMPVTALISM